MKKKLVSLAAALCLMLTLTGCGAKAEVVAQETDAFTVISRPAPEVTQADDGYDIRISLSIRFLKKVPSCTTSEFALKIDKNFIGCKVFVLKDGAETEAGEKIVHTTGNDTMILILKNAEPFSAKKGKFTYGVYYKGICIASASHE